MTKTYERWWEHDGQKLQRLLIEQCDRLLDLNAARHRLDLRHARLYGGSEIAGLAPWQYGRELNPQRLRVNVVAMNVETAVAKLCKNRPAPQFLTNGADYRTRQKAQRLNLFGRGCLHQSNWYEHDPVMVRDAATFGTAHLHHRAEGKVLVDERCLPWEVLTDPRESRNAKPRQLIHRTYIDRGVAIERYTANADGRSKGRIIRAIEGAEVARRNGFDHGLDDTSDQIEIVRGWHLRSGPEATDGWHAVVVRTGNGLNGVLESEEYDVDEFPFSKLVWEPGVVGYHGIGIGEKLTGIQFEINANLLKIQETLRIHGRTYAFIDSASGVPVSHVDNALDTVFIVDNGARPPTIVAPQIISPDLLNHVNTLIARSFNESGINEMNATANVPRGLDSGKAIREWNDTGDTRLVACGRRRESFCLDGVRRKLEVARSIKGFSVDVPNRREVVRIAWKDVELKESEYVLQVFPASMLSQTPAGRRQDVAEMQAAQWIDREKALELMDIPDLDDLYAKATATQRYVRAKLDEILDGEPAPAPEPRMRLDLALEIVTAVYLEESTHGAPEDVLEQLRTYQDELTKLVADARKAQQAAAQPAQPQPAPAPAQIAA